MEVSRLLNILDKIEGLKVDSQPIRDTISKLQNQIDVQGIENQVELLEVILSTKKFSAGEKPAQLVVLLKQIQEIQAGATKKSLKVNTTPQPSNMSNEILGLLSDLKKEMQDLKNTARQPINIQQEPVRQKSQIMEPLPIFINPNIKDVDIKSNLTIDSKKGGELTDKLSKLKNIRRK